MTEFVERYIELNNDLDDTGFQHSPEYMIHNVLTALQKHDKAVVQGFRGSMANEGLRQDVGDVAAVTRVVGVVR